MALPLGFGILLLLLSVSSTSDCIDTPRKEVCIVPGDILSLGEYNRLLRQSCKNDSQVIDINAFCEDEHHSKTVATFTKGTHALKSACQFKNVTDLTLIGSTNGTSMISCTPYTDAGFVFRNVSLLTVSSIQLTGCGSLCETKGSHFEGLAVEILAAVLLVGGSNVTLREVSVFNSKSAGIYIYNVANDVNLDSCSVANATSTDLEHVSGTVITYDMKANSTSANVQISRCYFTDSGYANPQSCSENHDKALYSSGLAVFIGNPTTTLRVVDTQLSSNTGCNGGNMALIFTNFSRASLKPSVSIIGTNFTRGHGWIGGGLCIFFKDSLSVQNSKDLLSGDKLRAAYAQAVVIADSRFVDNHATRNGGGIHIEWIQSSTLNEIVDISITDSTFDGNSIGPQGCGGLALHYKMYLEPEYNAHRVHGFKVNLNISGCSFNHHLSDTLQHSAETSVILAKSAPYFGIHNTTITSNMCTGILALNSVLVFSGTSLITNNTALSGGGVRLCSKAVMFFTPRTELVISNNTAMQTGGGIMVDGSCLLDVPMCFYQYSPDVVKDVSLMDSIRVRIHNNSAVMGGENIYGGSIEYCYFLSVQSTNWQYENLQVPNNTVSKPSSVSSRPQQVCFDELEDPLSCVKEKNASIYPGQTLTTFVRVVGQSNGAVPGTVFASTGNGARLDQDKQVQMVGIQGTRLAYTLYPAEYDTEEVDLILEVDLVSAGNINGRITRYAPAVIKVSFKKCPFGFTLSNISTEPHSCVCAIVNERIKSCSINTHLITKQPTAWVGTFNLYHKRRLATSTRCPFCDPSVTSLASSTYGLDQDKQCLYNRIGTLCGSCPENWSLVLGTPECRKDCSNDWLLLIIPFALVGLLLVLFIHILNMTVTVGTINGLIFYANVIQGYSTLLFRDYSVPILTPILRVFIAWFNLDLGIATCFYHRMTASEKNICLCIFPIYIWLISAAIIVLSKRYVSVTRAVGGNAVKVLATLFLLSFSKMVCVSINSLNASVLDIYTNGTLTEYKLRWFEDGTVPYFTVHSYFAMFVLSFIFVVLSLPFTLCLLCIRHVYSLSTCSRVFSRINKLKPFFDTYTGPFKDNARFWTGLLLVTRLFLLLVQALDLKSTVSPYYFIVTACLLLCALMIALNGVYKRHCLNILECFFILNLGFVFLVHTSANGMRREWKGIASHALISAALLVFAGIITYHMYLKVRGLGLARRLKALWQRDTSTLDVGNFDGARGFERGSVDYESSHESLIDASTGLAHFPPLENVTD